LIVFDASSVIAAALHPDRIPRRALARVRQDDRLAMSLPVADEIRNVLRRPKFARILTQDRIAEAEAWLFTEVDWFDPVLRVSDCRDAGDNKYLELVLAARASLLISSDADLLALHPWRGISILRPADYLALP
jgi:putative PIN family toxin of toxin-antitoxin system